MPPLILHSQTPSTTLSLITSADEALKLSLDLFRFSYYFNAGVAPEEVNSARYLLTSVAGW